MAIPGPDDTWVQTGARAFAFAAAGPPAETSAATVVEAVSAATAATVRIRFGRLVMCDPLAIMGARGTVGPLSARGDRVATLTGDTPRSRAEVSRRRSPRDPEGLRPGRRRRR